MPRYEYKIVPAPNRGVKAKGVKGAEARFSHGLEELMNGLAADGWEYQRAETLPSVERTGLTGTTTEWRNVLVFRRPRESDAEAFEPELLPAPAIAVAPIKTEADLDKDMPRDTSAQDTSAQDTPQKDRAEVAKTSNDNGVEDTSNTRNVGTSLTSLAAAREAEKSTD